MFHDELVDIRMGVLTSSEVDKLISKPNHFILNGKKRRVLIGKNALLKVNANIGVSQPENEHIEIEKLNNISSVIFSPDSLMDHTIIPLEYPLWKRMCDIFDGPVGTLPHYSTFQKNKGIEKEALLEKIHEMAEFGVAFMTLHPTANNHLFDIAANNRIHPTTSRGGALVLKDMQLNRKKINVFDETFEDILKIFKNYDIGLSIGSIFRPANNAQAMDEAHRAETLEQMKFAQKALDVGVKVMMEGVGHILLSHIPEYIKFKSSMDIPFMPLGPITSDVTAGYDHITSAVGSSYMGLLGGAQIINSITSEEHTGEVPQLNSILNGIIAARIAAQSVNVARFKAVQSFERSVSMRREEAKTCHVRGGIFNSASTIDEKEGCTRCDFECPLTLIN